MTILIREEQAMDVGAVRTVNESAFGQPEEAGIVDKLRDACDDLLSLVAVRNGEVVGHICFSPATIEGDKGDVRGMGLAPMAVLPELQRQGIGSKLIGAALAILRDRQCPFVIVLGHPEYYPRFGFSLSSRFGIDCEYEVPEEAFIAMELQPGALGGKTGK